MPEGDTVFLAATTLRRALAGRVIERSEFRVPRYANATLAGQRIDEVVPRGKHLLFRTDAGLTLHTHFMLDGTWHVYARGRRWLGEPHEIRAVLATSDHSAVGYRLARIDIVPTEEEHTLVGHLGPDPLGPDWSLDEALRRFSTAADREIGDALLDQTLVAGWGNAYKNEMLFLAGLDPWMRVREVSDLAKLLRLGRRILLANRTTGRWVTTGDLRRNQGQYVMERAGEPCRRCGTTIVRAKQLCWGNMRHVYWCPSCQPKHPGSAMPEGSTQPMAIPARTW